MDSNFVCNIDRYSCNDLFRLRPGSGSGGPGACDAVKEADSKQNHP